MLIDKSLVNQLAVIFCGRIGRLIFLIFFLLFIAIPVGSIVMTILFKSPAILLSLPIYALMFLLSIPALKIRQSVALIGYVSIVCALVSLLTSHDLLAILFGSAAVTFLSVRTYYFLDTMLMLNAAICSEAIFLYLFERAVIAIRDKEEGRVYCWRESGSVNDFS